MYIVIYIKEGGSAAYKEGDFPLHANVHVWKLSDNVEVNYHILCIVSHQWQENVWLLLL